MNAYHLLVNTGGGEHEGMPGTVPITPSCVRMFVFTHVRTFVCISQYLRLCMCMLCMFVYLGVCVHACSRVYVRASVDMRFFLCLFVLLVFMHVSSQAFYGYVS